MHTSTASGSAAVAALAQPPSLFPCCPAVSPRPDRIDGETWQSSVRTAVQCRLSRARSMDDYWTLRTVCQDLAELAKAVGAPDLSRAARQVQAAARDAKLTPAHLRGLETAAYNCIGTLESWMRVLPA